MKRHHAIWARDAKKDFFISYTSVDRAWAEWLAWQLEDVGYSVVLQAWDFRPGANFVQEMDKATQEAERTIAVLTPDYLNARYTKAEWNAAFRQDPTGEQGILLPVQVGECGHELKGLLGSIVSINLVGLKEPVARERLLAGVVRGRAKPTTPPGFPLEIQHSVADLPPFPGGMLPHEKLDEFPLHHNSGLQISHLTKPRLYVLLCLIILLAASLFQLSGYSPLFHSSAQLGPNADQENSDNGPLRMAFNAVQSQFWAIPGNVTQYSLGHLPEKHISAIYTDGHTSAPLYHIYFELHNLSSGHSNVVIEAVKLVIQQVRPMPHPVPIWVDGVSANYESLHKYEALYLGQERGVMLAQYVNSDYVTPNLSTVILSPGETDTIEVHIISRQEADVLFTVQVIYIFGTERQARTLTLSSLFEIMFVDRLDWHLYQLKDGHFVASS